LPSVESALRTSRLRPEQLVIEITEGTIISDQQATIAALRRLTRLGVSIALDDFGTGYSSLSYLRDLPVQIVKIDRSFIEHAGRGDADQLLLRSIIELSSALGLQTVAEGVERPEQLEQIQSMGCNLAQGFMFSRPLSAREFERFAADERWAQAA
jgi:EAL domain-containing protein (putative c-di-GMP-specific phosphodiesterase class I)